MKPEKRIFKKKFSIIISSKSTCAHTNKASGKCDQFFQYKNKSLYTTVDYLKTGQMKKYNENRTHL